MNRDAKITKFTMLDDYEVQGVWWLPGNKKDELSGNLYSEGGKICLDILGSFSEFLDDDTPECNYIHGFTVKGEEITLIDNFKISERFNMPGIPHQRFAVNSFIVGGHFTEINQVEFKSVNVASTHLTNWFNRRPFNKEQKLDDESKMISDTTSFIKPEVNTFYSPYLDAEISSHYFFKTSGNFVEYMSYLYTESFKITPTDWKSYEWFEEKIYSLNKLLTLLINEPTHIKKVVFEGDYENFKTPDGIQIRKKYHLYFRQRVMEEKKLEPHKMLFTFRDLKANFEKIMNNWFEREVYLKNAYNLYFSDFFNRNSDLETKFLNAAQTLEVYHRSQGYGKLFSDEEKDNYLYIVNEAIDKLVPSEIKDEINKKLKHFNEYSLLKRLKDIVDNLNDDTLSYLFKSKGKAKSFMSKVVDTRNYLTHYEEKGKGRRFKGIELYHATNLLKVLSGIQLFKELGLEEKVVLNAIKNNHKLVQIIPDSKSELQLT
ncbi:hypothetical protein F3157_12500 [Virgibacillus dakarensis]|nr:hypothetical protein [Virgibacillus dakarensis]